MLWKFIQHSFAGGILDRALQGRQDLERYFSSASKIKNFIVRKQGDIVKRRGTDEVCSLAKFLGMDRTGAQIPMRNIRVIPVTRSDADGRYLFITGGFCGVASKDGVMMCNDALFSRDIADFMAEDQYGNQINYAGTDVMHDIDSPYEVLHPTGSGVASSTYGTIAGAVAACESGDTIRLHGNVVLNADVSDDGIRYAAVFKGGLSVTIDTFGYDIVSRCGTYTFKVYDGASLRVTNSRGVASHFYERGGGSVFSVRGTGEFQESESSVWSHLVLDGNVTYHMNSSANIVQAGRRGDVTVNGGSFVGENSDSSRLVSMSGNSRLEINGGRFEARYWKSGSACFVVALFSDQGLAPTVVINGGYFKTPCAACDDVNGVYKGLVISICGTTTINGGMFVAPEGTPVVRGYKAYQSSPPNFLKVNRGYFSCSGVAWNGVASWGLADFLGDDSVVNSSYPDSAGMYGVKLVSDRDDYSYSPEDATVKIPFRMKVPYPDDVLSEIDYKQSGDTVFLTHRDYPPMKIAFDSDGYASVSSVKFDSDGVFPPVLDETEMLNNGHTSTTTTTIRDQAGNVTSTQTSSSTTSGAQKTVKYCVTYVKDGVESKPSNHVSVTYEAPWMQTAVVPLKWTKGDNATEPDYYNVYKDNGGGFGLIGTSWIGDQVVGRDHGTPDGGNVFVTDSTTRSVMAMMDYRNAYGLTAKDMYRKLSASRSGEITSRASGDTTVVVPAKSGETYTAVKEMTFTYPESANVVGDAVAVDLDGRYYDPETNNSYIVVSAHYVTCVVTMKNKSGGTVTKTLGPKYYDGASSSSGGAWPLWQYGVFSDWWTLPRSDMDCGGGLFVRRWLVGKGLQTEYFAAHNRRIVFDGFNPDGLPIVSVVLKFTNSVYSEWGSVQAVIHGMKVLKSVKDKNGFEDNYITPKMETTPPRTDVETHFIAGGDYPACVDFYQQRMVVASTWNDPFRFWMSMVGDLYNFCPHETMQENDPIEAETAAKVLPNINRILVTRDMILFTDGGEYKVAPVQGNTLSYKTVSAKLQSEIGIANWLKPACVKDEIVFVDRTGRNVFATKYNFGTDGYDSKELSVMSQDIFRENMIVDMAYRRHPESMIEFVQEDGTIADMVYMDEQGVTAWVKQELGGGFLAKCIACPETTNMVASTETMLAVERDGEYRLWLCRPNTDDDRVSASLCMDGMKALRGSDLYMAGAGDWTAVCEDGTTITAQQFRSGSATVSPEKTYHVGYEFDAELVTVRPEAQGERSSMQFEIKEATEVEVRTLTSGPFQVKAFGLGDAAYRTFAAGVSFSGGRVLLGDNDVKRTIVGSNNRDGRIAVRSRTPFQLNICYLAVTYQLEPENGGGNG